MLHREPVALDVEPLGILLEEAVLDHDVGAAAAELDPDEARALAGVA